VFVWGSGAHGGGRLCLVLNLGDAADAASVRDGGMQAALASSDSGMWRTTRFRRDSPRSRCVLDQCSQRRWARSGCPSVDRAVNGLHGKQSDLQDGVVFSGGCHSAGVAPYYTK
jgi:hypothetical protein